MSRYDEAMSLEGWRRAGRKPKRQPPQPKRPPQRAARRETEEEPEPEPEEEEVPEDFGAVRPWGPRMKLGENLRLRVRLGFRAAVCQIRPGLYLVAEVPEPSVELGFGPLLLAPALVRTLSRSLKRDPAGHVQPPVQQPALPAPRRESRLATWLDEDIAAELGCDACKRGAR